MPEGITDATKGADNIRLILRNIIQLTNNLAHLRGLYGTGYGRDGQHRGLQPRHARLAVASAVAFIDCVSETFRHKESLIRVETEVAKSALAVERSIPVQAALHKPFLLDFDLW